MIAMILTNEWPSDHIIDLRHQNFTAAGFMIGILLLALFITIHHIIKEVRHVPSH